MSRRVVYYLWRFPSLSETFIQRELRALSAAGIDVVVIADTPGDEDEAALGGRALPEVRYLLPVPVSQLLAGAAQSLIRRPLGLLGVLLYTLRHRYQVPASVADDLRVFLKIVHLARAMRRSGAEHVHAPWGDTTAFVAMMAARLSGMSFSVQFRAHDLHRATSSFLVAEKIRDAQFVVTNTEFNLRVLRALADPRDRDKIRRIYNGLELGPAPPGTRRAQGDTVRLLSVARLIEPKGLPYLFAACRTLLNSGYRLRCRVIGGPELPRYADDFAEIQSARQRLQLEDSVELSGAQSHATVAAAYADADIFVLPCVVGRDGSKDITPNSLLEAMASGLPVVSTTMTAIPELIEHGVSGLLVPPGDTAALAEAIASLIDDPRLRARLGAAARRRVEERFNIDRNIRSYVDLLAGRP